MYVYVLQDEDHRKVRKKPKPKNVRDYVYGPVLEATAYPQIAKPQPRNTEKIHEADVRDVKL